MPDDEEGMQALQLLSCPMDMLTMLYKVRAQAIHGWGKCRTHVVHDSSAES